MGRETLDSLDTARGGSEHVVLLSDEQDGGADEEDDRRQQVGQPEPDVFLGVDHADLSDQGSDVDEQVKVHEQPGRGESGVDEDLGPLAFFDDGSLTGDLFGDQGGDVGLEHSGTDSHDDDGDGEQSDDAAMGRENIKAISTERLALLALVRPTSC
jgi:hypothetical protein